MSRFKAGDLALVVGSTGFCPETIGMCVKLKTQYEIFSEIGWSWIGCEEFKVSGTLEKHLMPLRGDFTPEQTKQQECPVNA